jgi:hypothetical protein
MIYMSGVTRPSSGTVDAAYGTLMLLYVMIVSTVLSMGLWLMSYNNVVVYWLWVTRSRSLGW